MRKSLTGIKIAILVANGFDQQDFTAVQKTLNTVGASLKVVSPDQGLVNGWEGSGWGHHFPVDQQLASALGADFDILVVPGGQRSMDKLKTTAHTKRFVNSFMTSGKKVALFGDAVGLLAFAGQGDVAEHDNVVAIAGVENAADMIAFFAESAAAEDGIQEAA
jgi:protease I